jgi:DNA-binding NtrC family response regulator
MTPLVDDTVKRPMESPLHPAIHRAARLQVLFPETLSAYVDLDSNDLTLGRKGAGDGGRMLVLDDATVSRRHAQLSWNGQDHLLVDLESRNGSRVDGVRLTRESVRLEDGSVVRVGDVLLVYERGEAVEALDAPQVSHEAIFGRAARTVQLRALVAAAALDPAPVLLVGETGTGKEYIAREIHRLSARKGPLVAVNCAALSPQLVESQLFGHRRGAFTGADQDEPGLFRAADRGTILLDEVGELKLDLQAKLLRVLQEHEVLPVGATRPVPVHARVVAATLRDLRQLTDSGAFRLDLYARLAPWEIRVPPLSQRRADLLGWLKLLDHAWHERRGKSAPPPRLDANGLERLLLHRWPDNLRGIDRLVHHVCRQPSQRHYDLPSSWLDDAPPPSSTAASAAASAATPAAADELERQRRRARPTREELVEALERHNGSVRATAKFLGRERRLIYRWMELYDLREK